MKQAIQYTLWGQPIVIAPPRPKKPRKMKTCNYCNSGECLHPLSAHTACQGRNLHCIYMQTKTPKPTKPKKKC